LPGEKHVILPGPVTPLKNGSATVTSRPQNVIIASVQSYIYMIRNVSPSENQPTQQWRTNPFTASL